jgi:hypothetical protein
MTQYLSDVPSEYAKHPQHGPLLSGIDKVLAEQAPGQVSPREIFITGEKLDTCIVLVPHHCLGGTSLIVTSRASIPARAGLEDSVWISWAQVTDLETHDEIDLGKRISTIPWQRGDSLPRIASAVLGELERPISIRIKRTNENRVIRADYMITTDGREARVGSDVVLRSWPPWRKTLRTQEVTTLRAEAPPSLSFPVPLAGWRRVA